MKLGMRGKQKIQNFPFEGLNDAILSLCKPKIKLTTLSEIQFKSQPQAQI